MIQVKVLYSRHQLSFNLLSKSYSSPKKPLLMSIGLLSCNSLIAGTSLIDSFNMRYAKTRLVERLIPNMQCTNTRPVEINREEYE